MRAFHAWYNSKTCYADTLAIISLVGGGDTKPGQNFLKWGNPKT